MTRPRIEADASGTPDAGSSADHLPVLDGLRGLAILLVMEHHFWGLSFGLAGRPTALAVDRFASRLLTVGWSGVDLFFVLSGFLITGILYDAKHSGFYFRNFYARRVLRIFPLYYAFLVFALLILPLFPRISGPGQVHSLRDVQVWYWTYTVNIGSAIHQLKANIPIVHSQFWSLAVEEQFYLIWPLLVLVFSRRTMMTLSGVLVVFALAFRFYLISPAASSFANLNAAHVLLPARVDTLALGALLALALRGGIDLGRYRPCALAVAAGTLVTLVVLFFTQDGLSTLNKRVETIGFSALALLFVSLLLLAITSKPKSALHHLLSSSPLRMLGRYSYAIYVFHLLLAFELATEVIHRDAARTVLGSQIPMNVAFSLLCTVASVVIGWLSWNLFEKQILKLKRFVPYGGPERSTLERPAPSEQRALASP